MTASIFEMYIADTENKAHKLHRIFLHFVLKINIIAMPKLTKNKLKALDISAFFMNVISDLTSIYDHIQDS